MIEKHVLNNKGRVIGQREVRPVWNNTQSVNHQNKLTHPYPKRNFVPTAVATKSGLVPVNAAKQSSPRAAASISTARHVNAAALKPKVNAASPTKYSYFKAHSPLRTPFNQKSATKTNNLNEKVKTARVNNVTTDGSKVVVNAAVGNSENAVKSLAYWILRPTGKVIDHISKDSRSYMPKRFDYVDPQGRLNGCSRHMTGNKSYLTDYQDINGLKDLPPSNDTYETPSHTKKVFSNMARQSKSFSGKVTLLFESMLVHNQALEGESSVTPPKPQPTPSTLQPNVSEPQTKLHQTKTPPTVSHEPQTEANIEKILPSPSIYQRKHKKTQKHRRDKTVTELPQTSVPLDLRADKAVYKEGVTVWKGLSLLMLA
ncbi:hypothetical protein Tco_1299382 [Tanacetum coccineum]